ncbi:MAG: hypothetical protein HPY66_1730 [Firmicutes bacterium]|nr:hypothetical protein [Bacillota bacterium]
MASPFRTFVDGFWMFSRDNQTQITFILGRPIVSADGTHATNESGQFLMEAEEQGVIIMTYDTVKKFSEYLIKHIEQHDKQRKENKEVE